MDGESNSFKTMKLILFFPVVIEFVLSHEFTMFPKRVRKVIIILCLKLLNHCLKFCIVFLKMRYHFCLCFNSLNLFVRRCLIRFNLFSCRRKLIAKHGRNWRLCVFDYEVVEFVKLADHAHKVINVNNASVMPKPSHESSILLP